MNRAETGSCRTAPGLIALCLLVTACHVPPPIYMVQAIPPATRLPGAPPPNRLEVPPPPPDEGYVWQDGYWSWDGDDYSWVDGAWVPPEPGYDWVPAAYAYADGCWSYTPPYWCPSHLCSGGRGRSHGAGHHGSGHRGEHGRTEAGPGPSTAPERARVSAPAAPDPAPAAVRVRAPSAPARAQNAGSGTGSATDDGPNGPGAPVPPRDLHLPVDIHPEGAKTIVIRDASEEPGDQASSGPELGRPLPGRPERPRLESLQRDPSFRGELEGRLVLGDDLNEGSAPAQYPTDATGAVVLAPEPGRGRTGSTVETIPRGGSGQIIVVRPDRAPPRMDQSPIAPTPPREISPRVERPAAEPGPMPVFSRPEPAFSRPEPAFSRPERAPMFQHRSEPVVTHSAPVFSRPEPSVRHFQASPPSPMIHSAPVRPSAPTVFASPVHQAVPSSPSRQQSAPAAPLAPMRRQGRH